MSPGRPEPYARALAEPAAAELGLRTFWLGVTGCTTAVAVFLLARLTAWPPHEDETLALFVGRKSLGELFKTVQTERGGAPLHFLFAWLVAHLGGGLVGLRLFSALFAVASVPVMALLCARLAGRTAALAATALVSASWMLLFHGIYGRMYSLFLLTSALSYVAFLAAVAEGGRRRWALWAVAILATVATHPYGALVLATQVVYVLARARTRAAFVAIATVAVLGSPFWYSDHVLAGRFDVGVGAGGQKLDGPGAVLEYLYRVAGDFTAGFTPVVIAVLVVAVVGARALWLRNRDAALLTACVVLVPTAAFVLARFGQSTSPESRHLIFVLPFFALLVALGLIDLSRKRTPVLVAALVLLMSAEVAWGWDKTAPLYQGEPEARVDAREAASAWLARTARPDDVLFGYEPLYLGAWERAPQRLLGHRDPPGGREARAEVTPGGRHARPRSLGLRRERHQQLHAEADDSAALPESQVGLRGARLRAVPRHPQQAADADAEGVPARDAAGPDPREIARRRRRGREPAHRRPGSLDAREVAASRSIVSS